MLPIRSGDFRHVVVPQHDINPNEVKDTLQWRDDNALYVIVSI